MALTRRQALSMHGYESMGCVGWVVGWAGWLGGLGVFVRCIGWIGLFVFNVQPPMQGYDNDNGLNEEVVPQIAPSRVAWPADGMHRTNDLSPEMVRSYLLIGRVVIANVRNGRHFVLVKVCSHRRWRLIPPFALKQ